jgi:ferric-dicitrate binding protein FerR (iron transport regulator)
MTAPRYSRLATKMLAVETPASAPTLAERERAIEAMEHTLGERRQRQRRRIFLGAAAAAAFLVFGTFGAAAFLARRTSSPAHASAAPPTAAESAPVAESAAVGIVVQPIGAAGAAVVEHAVAPLAPGGWRISRGSRVVTTQKGRAIISFSTGTNVELEEASDMSVEGAGASQELRLDSGAIDLHVAALGVAQRFVVRTPDTEIEVHGTRFRVALAGGAQECADGTTTRVAVSEGVVVVRRGGVETRLRAGDRWPAKCDAMAAVPRALLGPERLPAGPPAISTLGEQNDLFAAALEAKRRGDWAGAAARYAELLARYPSSPLAESAMVERLRILRASDPAGASGAATQYLARYPHGFARAQAEAILAEAR